jgi:hypothetical protein
MTPDQHPYWARLDFYERRFLQYLPIHGSEGACARAMGKNAHWLSNRKRKPGFRELIALRRAGGAGSIPGFDEEQRLYAQMTLDLLMEQDQDRKVRAMAARALRRRA